MNRLAATALVGVSLIALGACQDDAHRVSENLSIAADNFEVQRRIPFYNTMNGDYMLSMEGLCSLGRGSESESVTVTCKLGPSKYKKHYLGLSRNVTYFVEQVDAVDASPYHYRVIYKPANIIPDIQIK